MSLCEGMCSLAYLEAVARVLEDLRQSKRNKNLKNSGVFATDGMRHKCSVAHCVGTENLFRGSSACLV